MWAADNGGKSIERNISRADIIKEGGISKPQKYFDVVRNSSSGECDIDGLCGFSKSPWQLYPDWKVRAEALEESGGLQFFPMSEVSKKIL